MADYRFYLDRVLTKKKQQIGIAPADQVAYFNQSGTNYAQSPQVTTTGESFTVEFWTYLPDPTKDMWFVNQRSSSSGSDRDWQIFRFGTTLKAIRGTIYNNINQIFGTERILSDDYPPQDIWVHIALVVDNANKIVRTYENGVEAASRSFTGDINGSSPMRIGMIGWNVISSLQLNGYMSELRIWSKARTQAEILSTINQQVANNSTNLKCYIKFNEIIAGKFPDVTGNGYNATITGSIPIVNNPTI